MNSSRTILGLWSKMEWSYEEGWKEMGARIHPFTRVPEGILALQSGDPYIQSYCSRITELLSSADMEVGLAFGDIIEMTLLAMIVLRPEVGDKLPWNPWMVSVMDPAEALEMLSAKLARLQGAMAGLSESPVQTCGEVINSMGCWTFLKTSDVRCLPVWVLLA